MGLFHNGMAADEIADVTWRKSQRSNSQGNCVEMAELTDGSVAMRNSRHPSGPALVYTRAEVEALILVAMSIGFTLAARYTLAALERMARREGRLSIRWQ